MVLPRVATRTREREKVLFAEGSETAGAQAEAFMAQERQVLVAEPA